MNVKSLYAWTWKHYMIVLFFFFSNLKWIENGVKIFWCEWYIRVNWRIFNVMAVTYHIQFVSAINLVGKYTNSFFLMKTIEQPACLDICVIVCSLMIVSRIVQVLTYDISEWLLRITYWSGSLDSVFLKVRKW